MTQENSQPSPERRALLDAALNHVPFDGWSDVSFNAAVAETGLDPAVAERFCPRRALDLAADYHRRGDTAMAEGLAAQDLSEMRFRDRVTLAIRLRIEAIDDKEVVRRGAILFALPQHMAEGSRLIWGTADLIWTSLGDTSEDINWYTKRSTLSAVYGSTVLYWLGDQSADHQDTWAFLDRRIEDVMAFEKLKSGARGSALFRPFLPGADWLAQKIRRPGGVPRSDLPGRWAPNEGTTE